MGDVLLLSLTAALNPTLVAAATLMMLLPNPMRLMLGYLAGAMMTSITLGVVIVFALKDSGIVSTTRHTLSPAATMALGAIALTAAFVLATGRPHNVTERRQARKERRKDKGPPRWQRAIGRGSARITFVVGAMLTLPGASYLAGLRRIEQLGYPDPATVVVVVVFNVIMLSLLEIPLLAFLLAPDWTPKAIERARGWLGRHARRFAVRLLTVVGLLLILKGVIELIS